MKYVDFDLDDGLQEGLQKMGYTECLPVQEAVLAKGMDGSDLYVQSQTGTGKTAGYLVTIFQRLATKRAEGPVLILVPTRELAVQVSDEAKLLSKFMDLKVTAFYGGVGYNAQLNSLKAGVDIMIGTPGRVIDLADRKVLKLDKVGFLVIDEADRMFDMGFYPDLRKLLRFVSKPEERQTMLFSATLNNHIKNLAWEYTVNAKEINLEPENITAEKIEQKLLHVAQDKKLSLLLGLLKRENPEIALVFCNTKKTTEVLAKRLKVNGINADFLSGDLPQNKRMRVVQKLKDKEISVLIATDVAARGLDIADLPLVINYDLPDEAANYVHRIGRTARAGNVGVAYTLCSERDVYNIAEVEKFIGESIPAQMPSDDLYLEDVSEGQYIQLDRNKNSRGRYKDGGRNSKKQRQRGGKRNERAKNDSGASTNRRRGKSKRGGDAEKLANLTFEERMEYYKKKHSKKASEGNSAKNGKSERVKHKKNRAGAKASQEQMQSTNSKKRNKRKRNFENNSSGSVDKKRQPYRGKKTAKTSASTVAKTTPSSQNGSVNSKKNDTKIPVIGFIKKLFKK